MIKFTQTQITTLFQLVTVLLNFAKSLFIKKKDNQ